MPIYRYSAAEQFGVPIQNEVLRNTKDVFLLLGRYSIEREVQAPDPNVYPLDITPYYWSLPVFRHMLTVESDTSAQIDMLPTEEGNLGVDLSTGEMKGYRSVPVLPGSSGFVLAGGSPRFNQICLHEVIIHEDK